MRAGRGIREIIQESSLHEIINNVKRFNGWLIALKNETTLQNMHNIFIKLAQDYKCRISCLICYDDKIITITFKKFDNAFEFITIFNPSSFGPFLGAHYLVADHWEKAALYLNSISSIVKSSYFKLNNLLSKEEKRQCTRENIVKNVYDAASASFEFKV